MDLATISLWALLGTVLLSCVLSLNVGLIAFTLAWVIGTWVAPQYGMDVGTKGVLEGFPVPLAVTLIGVSLLFSHAQSNGTLDSVAQCDQVALACFQAPRSANAVLRHREVESRRGTNTPSGK